MCVSITETKWARERQRAGRDSLFYREKGGGVCVTEIERDMLVIKSLEWEYSFNSS